MQQEETSGKYFISFEDGSQRQVRAEDAFVCELLPVGQQVLASEDGTEYLLAQVTSCWRKGVACGYTVEFALNKRSVRFVKKNTFMQKDYCDFGIVMSQTQFPVQSGALTRHCV